MFDFLDKIENGEVHQRRRGPNTGHTEGHEVNTKPQEQTTQTSGSWRRIVLLILAITIHNIPGGSFLFWTVSFFYSSTCLFFSNGYESLKHKVCSVHVAQFKKRCWQPLFVILRGKHLIRLFFSPGIKMTRLDEIYSQSLNVYVNVRPHGLIL